MSRFKLATYSSEPIKKSEDFRSSLDYLDSLLSHCGNSLKIYRPELADQCLKNALTEHIVARLIKNQCRVSILVCDGPMFVHNCKDLARLSRKAPSLVRVRRLSRPFCAESFFITGENGFATMIRPGHWITTESPAMAQRMRYDFERDWQKSNASGSLGQCYL